MHKCDALRDLVPFAQFKKREKHPWRSVNFSEVAGLKLTLLHRCFSSFLNCTNGPKSRNAPHSYTHKSTVNYLSEYNYRCLKDTSHANCIIANI